MQFWPWVLPPMAKAQPAGIVQSRAEAAGEAGVATVSAVLTVGSSGGGRVTANLLWTGQRQRRVPSRLTACRWSIGHEKSPRSPQPLKPAGQGRGSSAWLDVC